MRASARVNPDLLAHGPPSEWQHGYGLWTNEHGQLWPDLPQDGFTASGAGGHYVTGFPSLDLVVVQNPGPYHRATGAARANPALLRQILDAVRA